MGWLQLRELNGGLLWLKYSVPSPYMPTWHGVHVILPSLYGFQYRDLVLHPVFGSQKSIRNSAVAEKRATHLYKCNGMADLLKHAPPDMCYHAKFGHSALKGNA